MSKPGQAFSREQGIFIRARRSSAPELATTSKPRVLVFGLDGATWGLLDKLVDDGTMPSLASLRRSSVYGDLISTVPPDTPTGWGSLARGISPGGTGVFGFHRPGESVDSFKPVASFEARGASFPELLEKEGLSVVLINFPTVSFPLKIHGPVLGDILSPSRNLVSPPSLAAEAPFRDYRVFPSVPALPDTDKYLRDIRKLEATRFACAQRLFESEWDLFFVMFSATDWIQHELFSDLLHGQGQHLPEAKTVYHDLDGYLGWFASRLAERDSIIVVSDHGFEERSGMLSVNLWLAEHGYLAQKFNSEQVLLRAGPEQVRVPGWILNRLYGNRYLWSLSAKLARTLFGQSLDVRSFNVPPDPEKTLAYYVEFDWGIYLNSKRRFERGLVDGDQEKGVAMNIVADLRRLVDSGLLRDVKLGSEVYRGSYADAGPDVVIYPSEYSFCGLSSQLVSRFPPGGRYMMRNAHSMNGIYLVRNQHVQPGRNGEREILDIFPTVLNLFGVSVPSQAEGRSMVSSTRPDSQPPLAQPTEPSQNRVVTEDEEEEIMSRLKRLGYF